MMGVALPLKDLLIRQTGSDIRIIALDICGNLFDIESRLYFSRILAYLIRKRIQPIDFVGFFFFLWLFD